MPIVDVNVENINDIRSRLNICINNILFDVYEDNFGNEYTRQNFNIYKEMTNEDAECFLSLLNDFLVNNIFSYNLDITELLVGCGIESSGENVSADSLRELNDIFNSIKDNKELYRSLLTFITKEFNKLYKPKPVIHNIFDDFDDSDLPF